MQHLLMLGKMIAEDSTVVTLNSINQPMRYCVTEGKIFSIEQKTLQSKKELVIFNITDFENSISCKVFLKPKQTLEIKEGQWVRVAGKVEIDEFYNELTITPEDINVIEAKGGRVDAASVKRVELHAHTKMSAMDSVADTTELINTAISFGHPAIAITDHGVVQAFPDAFRAAGGKIKIIYGLEGYYLNDGEQIACNMPKWPISKTNWVVLDFETTGFNPTTDEIIEIGAVKICNGELVDSFSVLINPGREVSQEITEFTGITNEMLEGQPTIQDMIVPLLKFIGVDSILVAHNAMFDLRFLQTALRKCGYNPAKIPILDTMNLSRALLPDLKNHKLNTLAKKLDVELVDHHRAVNDAEATAKILLKLLVMINGNEQIKDRLDLLNVLSENIDYKKGRTYHMCLLARNYIGLKNLYKLVSYSHIDFFYRNPRLPKAVLQEHREGLLVGSACESGWLYQEALRGATDDELRDIISFFDYVELQPLCNNEFLVRQNRIESVDALKALNERLYHLAKSEGKIVVAAGDVHFVEPKDGIYREILMDGKNFEDAEEQAPLYFRTTEEMLQEFNYFGPDIAYELVVGAPNKIAEMCEMIRPVPDGLFPPTIEGAEEEIRQMTYKSAEDLYAKPLPKIVADRVERELNSIIGNGFAVNYLIAHRLVKKSLGDGYLVGSRGSVGSSLVATFCGITEVNPLPPHYICGCGYHEFITDGLVGCGPDLPDKVCPICGVGLVKEGHDIPFETFMGFEGDKVPDIDLNFSGENQAGIHRYTEELFGKDHVFRAGTISTIADRTAYGFVRKFVAKRGFDLRNAEINRLVKGCAGVRRTTGQHPGGQMIVPNAYEVFDFCPVQYPANKSESGVITTHFDYHSLHDNLLKLDILGHDDPTAIRMLQDLTGVNPTKIPLDDKRTIKLFSSCEPLGINPEQIGTTVGTLGVPEFGTEFVRRMLEQTRPTTFAELVRISGLSHGEQVWTGNAQDLISKGAANLSQVISVRDDIMNYLILKGLDHSTAFKIMENVRKGKGLKPEWEEVMKSHKVPRWYIESCNKIRYMFPKAHATAYVTMAFRIAYFKVHWPLQFYCVHFSIKAEHYDAQLVSQGLEAVLKEKARIEALKEPSPKENNLHTVLEVVAEAMLRGIKFGKVDLYKSDATRFIIDGDTLIPPFVSLNGLGANACQRILESRASEPFMSVEDLVNRTKVTKTVIASLKEHGSLEGLPGTNQLTLF